MFDPSTGRFASTADMSETRGGHSATLLLDGRVLVAGGFSFEATGRDGVALPAPNCMLHRIVDDEWGDLDHRRESSHPPEWCPRSRRVGIEDCLDRVTPSTSSGLITTGTSGQGSSWTFLGPTFPGAVARDGTTVPDATQIVDDEWGDSGPSARIEPSSGMVSTQPAGGGCRLSGRVTPSTSSGLITTGTSGRDPAGRFWDQRSPARRVRRHHGSPCDTDRRHQSGDLDHRPESRHPPEWCPRSRRVGVADCLDESHPLRPRD